jgi:hypothetical protein
LALSYWIDYLGFIIEGKLAAVLITPSLGVSNWSVIYIINTAPSRIWKHILKMADSERKWNELGAKTKLIRSITFKN